MNPINFLKKKIKILWKKSKSKGWGGVFSKERERISETKRKWSLSEFFSSSPLADIDLSRDKSLPCNIEESHRWTRMNLKFQTAHFPLSFYRRGARGEVRKRVWTARRIIEGFSKGINQRNIQKNKSWFSSTKSFIWLKESKALKAFAYMVIFIYITDLAQVV